MAPAYPIAITQTGRRYRLDKLATGGTRPVSNRKGHYGVQRPVAYASLALYRCASDTPEAWQLPDRLYLAPPVMAYQIRYAMSGQLNSSFKKENLYSLIGRDEN
jgi:hypothetical protein